MKWIDLPQPMNCFTVRSAMMMDLKKRISVQQYSANTKIVVVQKCILPEGTFYRTETAKKRDLDWAFKASAFGLPDEKAPSVHSSTSNSHFKKARKPARTSRPAKKQTSSQKIARPKGGGAEQRRGWLYKVKTLRRKYGKTKNS